MKLLTKPLVSDLGSITPRTGFLISESDIQFIFKRGSLDSGIYMIEVLTINNIKLGVSKIVIE